MKKYLLLCVFFLLLFLSSCGGAGSSFSSPAVEELEEEFRIEKIQPSTSSEYFEWLSTFPEDVKEFPEWWNKNEADKWIFFYWNRADTYKFEDYMYFPCDFWFLKRGTGEINFNCHIGDCFVIARYGGNYIEIEQGGKDSHAVMQFTDSEGVFFISFCGVNCGLYRTIEEIYEKEKIAYGVE